MKRNTPEQARAIRNLIRNLHRRQQSWGPRLFPPMAWQTTDEYIRDYYWSNALGDPASLYPHLKQV